MLLSVPVNLLLIPEQSGFTISNLTTDCILALCVLAEHQYVFRQRMLAAYVGLKKAFDSVHCEVLWNLLQLCGIPARTTGLLTGPYSETERVGLGEHVQLLFHQHESKAGLTLSHCFSAIVWTGLWTSHCGASVGNTRYIDLVFADDARIHAESQDASTPVTLAPGSRGTV